MILKSTVPNPFWVWVRIWVGCWRQPELDSGRPERWAPPTKEIEANAGAASKFGRILNCFFPSFSQKPRFGEPGGKQSTAQRNEWIFSEFSFGAALFRFGLATTLARPKQIRFQQTLSIQGNKAWEGGTEGGRRFATHSKSFPAGAPRRARPASACPLRLIRSSAGIIPGSSACHRYGKGLLATAHR